MLLFGMFGRSASGIEFGSVQKIFALTKSTVGETTKKVNNMKLDHNPGALVGVYFLQYNYKCEEMGTWHPSCGIIDDVLADGYYLVRTWASPEDMRLSRETHIEIVNLDQLCSGKNEHRKLFDLYYTREAMIGDHENNERMNKRIEVRLEKEASDREKFRLIDKAATKQ